jgi:hypothetical protein
VAERGHVVVHLQAHIRDEHEWVSRAGGLFRFVLLEVVVNGVEMSGTRAVILVTDLDNGEEP